MSHRDVMARAWRHNHLYSALLELTYRCNLDCFFCYNDLGQRGKPLARSDYEALLQGLAELQTFEITLTGGEPLAHADFFHIGGRARELGFVVRIKSNGHALAGALARRLREEVDPFLVDISLHGATPEVHDRQTRVPGSFVKLMDNLVELRALGLRVKLNATLTRWNEHQIDEMAALARRLELPLALNATVTPRDNGDPEPLAIAPTAAGIRRLFALRFQSAPETAAADDVAPPERRPRAEPEKNCGAGSSGIAVDPYGNVYPCVQWRRSIGNLHERGIQQIWAGSDELDDIRSLTVEARRTREALGPVGAGMNFCLGLSQEKTGDPLGIDPEALREAEILDEFLRQRPRDLLRVVR